MPPSAQLSSELGTIDAQFQNPVDIYNAALNRLGVGDARTKVKNLQGEVSNTESLLKKLEGDLLARTSGSLVTENQYRGLLQREQKPLFEQLEGHRRALDIEQEGMNRLENQGRMEADLQLEGYRTRRQGLFERLQLALQAEESQKDRAAAASSWAPNIPSVQGEATPVMVKRKGGGYNFTDQAGKAISAAKYAQLRNIPIGDLLYSMGQGGDKYAAQLYNQLKSNQAYYNKNPNALKQHYSPIFWGT